MQAILYNVISKVNISNVSNAGNGKINVILTNCGPGVAPPGAEFTGTNQICQINMENTPNASNIIFNNVTSKVNISNVSNAGNGNINVILPNCGPGVEPPGGEFAGTNQICQINVENTPNASNIIFNNVISKVNISHVSNAGNGKINVILPNCGIGVAPPGGEFTVSCQISQINMESPKWFSLLS